MFNTFNESFKSVYSKDILNKKLMTFLSLSDLS